MQLMQFFFGLATASEVAYFSYIYSVVEPAQYQRVTSYCRSITLFGSAAGSLTGQLLLSVAKVKLFHLVIITLASSVVAFLAPWFLPMPRRSLFFHKIPATFDSKPRCNSATLLQTSAELESRVPLTGHNTTTVSTVLFETLNYSLLSVTESFNVGTLFKEIHWSRLRNLDYEIIDFYFTPDVTDVQKAFSTAQFSMQISPVKDGENNRNGFVDVMRMFFSDFVQCYRCRTLLSWSLWWALATCGYFQVINYAQALWEKVRPSRDYEIYNGYVETLSTLLGKGSSRSW